jgi:hypothetical protein
MELIRQAAGQDLQWTPAKVGERAFELHSGYQVLALLYSQKGTNRMIGEAADGRWAFAFRRRSFWNADIVITWVASQAEIAVVKLGSVVFVTRPCLAFSDGRLFTFKKTSFWREEWVWLNKEGTPLMHFQHSNHLIVVPSALRLREPSLLVIVGWYLIVLRQEVARRVQDAGPYLPP